MRILIAIFFIGVILLLTPMLSPTLWMIPFFVIFYLLFEVTKNKKMYVWATIFFILATATPIVATIIGEYLSKD